MTNKLTTEDWESSLMDRISNNVTQDYGHELEKIDNSLKENIVDDDQIHEVLAMIKEDHYVYEKIIERLNYKLSDMLEMYRFGLSHVTNDFTEELDTYKDELELLNQLKTK